MRVLFVSNFYPPDYLGGVELYTHGIAHELRRLGIAVQVLCAADWTSGPQHFNGASQDEYEQVPVYRLHLNWSKAPDPFRYQYDNPAVGRETEHLIEQFNPSVMHITSCEPLSASVLFAAKHLGIPVVMTLAGYWFICPRIILLHADGHVCDARVSSWDCTKCLAWGAKVYRWSKKMLPDAILRSLLSWVGRQPWLNRQRGLVGMIGDMDDRRRILREAFEAADLVLAISPYVKQVFAHSGQMPAGNIRVHEWGLPDITHVQSAAVDHTGPLRISYFGRVAPIKGLEVLLCAFKALQGDAVLAIHGNSGGGGPDYDRALRRIADNDPHIRFMGPYRREAMPALLAQTDVVVVPSVCPETFCLVPREALMAGVPVVASRIGAIPDAVRHGENGLLFEAGDVGGLASALQRLLDDRNLWRRLAQNTCRFKTVREECDELIEIYQSCLATWNVSHV